MPLEELLASRAEEYVNYVPVIPWYYEEAFEAWYYVQKFRSSGGFGPGKITFSDCVLYCEKNQIIEHVQQLWFCEQIIIIDISYLTVNAEKGEES